jgi:hypothetical protein
MITSTAGELFEEAYAAGMAEVGAVPAGIYELEIASFDIYDTALRPLYRVRSGPAKAGTCFNGFKWNLTPKGVRRFKGIVRAWGYKPVSEDSLESIAEVLKGRVAACRVEVRDFHGMTFNDVDQRSIKLVRVAQNDAIVGEDF